MSKQSRWSLQDAKAKFSELVRRAGANGPQHVTVHGKEKVVVVSAVEFERLTARQPSGETGARLIKIMRDSRVRNFDFQRETFETTVRGEPDFNGDL